MTRRNMLALAFAALTAAAGFCSADYPSAGMRNLSVKADKEGELVVIADIDPASFSLPGESDLLLQPMVYNADSTHCVQLPPVMIAGRTRHIRYSRDPRRMPQDCVLLRSGKEGTYKYVGRAKYEPWMEQARVGLEMRERGCCNNPGREKWLPIARLDLRDRKFAAPDFSVAPPVVSGDKIQELHGKAFVDFPVNLTEIFPAYRKNPEELAKIMATINAVKDNPDATITEITIKGFASPEGSYANNTRLAKGRAESLTKYVRSKYDFPANVFHSDFEPEDWQGLRDSVKVSFLPDRDGLLEIIDSKMAPDAKDAELKKRYPRDYEYLLSTIYPALRHSDYAVKYKIRKYTDIEEIKRVFHERPQNLSISEFHLLASTLPKGSPEYDEVFETAVRMYPDDETSNLNAAVVSVGRGEYDKAGAYLAKAGKSRYSGYIEGILLAKEGDADAARKLLEEASKAGVPEAAEALKRLAETNQSAESTTYLPDPGSKEFVK